MDMFSDFLKYSFLHRPSSPFPIPFFVFLSRVMWHVNKMVCYHCGLCQSRLSSLSYLVDLPHIIMIPIICQFLCPPNTSHKKAITYKCKRHAMTYKCKDVQCVNYLHFHIEFVCTWNISHWMSISNFLDIMPKSMW